MALPIQESKTKGSFIVIVNLKLYFTFKATSGGDKAYLRLQSPRLEGALSGALHDACVPFPKTSGARFSHVGILVTFSQSLNSKGLNLKHQNTTPRFVILPPPMYVCFNYAYL